VRGAQPPAVRHVENTTCSCCGPSSKLPNISVKLQLNLHQNEPFQVKKSQNCLGRGSPLPTPHLRRLNRTPSGMSGYGPASSSKCIDYYSLWCWSRGYAPT